MKIYEVVDGRQYDMTEEDIVYLGTDFEAAKEAKERLTYHNNNYLTACEICHSYVGARIYEISDDADATHFNPYRRENEESEEIKMKITKCTGEGQGSCKRCSDNGKWNRIWMCFLYKIEGYDGYYCADCVKEIQDHPTEKGRRMKKSRK